MNLRLARSAPSAFCLLSLVACVATGALWVRSYGRHGDEEGDRTSFRAPRGRYAVTSRRGEFVLHGPPPTDTSEGARARELVAGMSNDGVTWRKMVSHADGGDTSGTFGAGLDREPLLSLWLEFDPPTTAAPLLEALEDPGRFAAADNVLREEWNDTITIVLPHEPLPDGGAVLEYASGLRVELRQVGPPVPEQSDVHGYVMAYRGAPAVTLDLSRLPTVRDHWHRRLAVPVASAPHWLVSGVTGLAPLAWAAARLRRARVRHRRRRLGLCERCGYDLRESAGRCSECGGVI